MMEIGQYDYGKCHICGEAMEERRVKHDFWLKGELLVIEDVPTGVCPQCGEKVVRADVGRKLAAIIADPDRLRRARNISVPVIDFYREAA